MHGPTEKETCVMWAPCQKILAVFLNPTIFVIYIYYTAVLITLLCKY